MPNEVVEAIVHLLAITSIGTMVLIGLKMRLNARLRSPTQEAQAEGRPEELERLTDAVEGLNEQVRLMRDEFTDLHERVDFAERLLSRGSVQPAEPGVPTPQ